MVKKRNSIRSMIHEGIFFMSEMTSFMTFEMPDKPSLTYAETRSISIVLSI